MNEYVGRSEVEVAVPTHDAIALDLPIRIAAWVLGIRRGNYWL